MDQQTSTSDRSTPGSIAGFLATAFCIVGLSGLFATYAAPLAYQREFQREATLDQALRTSSADMASLSDRLDDSADAILKGKTPLPERVAAERLAMRARFSQQAEDTAFRLRLLIVIVTLASALFGAATVFMRR